MALIIHEPLVLGGTLSNLPSLRVTGKLSDRHGPVTDGVVHLVDSREMVRIATVWLEPDGTFEFKYGPRPASGNRMAVMSTRADQPLGAMLDNQVFPALDVRLIHPADVPDLSGPGYLGGSFPSGITTVDGTPVPATIRIHLRPEEGAQGDGILIAQTTSAADGTWRVDNLDPALKFDIVGRRAGFNDVIVANVSPTPYHQIVIEGDLALETDDG